MNDHVIRRWWPFELESPIAKESAESNAKREFLDEVTRIGAKGYVQNNELECGAVSENGCECLVIWRGKQRAEVLLINCGKLSLKQSFFSTNECEAFRQAADKGLEWIKC